MQKRKKAKYKRLISVAHLIGENEKNSKQSNRQQQQPKRANCNETNLGVLGLARILKFHNFLFSGLRKLLFQYFTFGVGEYYRGIIESAQVKQLQRYVPSLKVQDVER